MNEVTRILAAIDRGDPRAADQLLPLVYDELRRLAAQRLAREKPGQTLQANRPGARGLRATGGWRTSPGTGTAGATSSARRPRPCGASSSRTPGANGGSSTAVRGGGSTWTRPPWRNRRAGGRAAGRRRGPGSPVRRGSAGRRAGQAALLRRADHRAGRRGRSACRREKGTGSGLMPGPGCSAPGRGRGRRRLSPEIRPRLAVIGPGRRTGLVRSSASPFEDTMMSATSPDVKSIFGRALEIESPAERSAFLGEACAANPELAPRSRTCSARWPAPAIS